MYDVVFNDRKTGPKLQTFSSSRSPWQYEQWLREQDELEKVLNVCREDDIWPMNETACNFCPFHIVCAQSTEAGIAAQLTSHFRVKHWDSMNRETD
jgi:hypothetical protein